MKGALANSIAIPHGISVEFFKEDNLKGDSVELKGPAYIQSGGIPGLGPAFKSMRVTKDAYPSFKGAWLLAASGSGTLS